MCSASLSAAETAITTGSDAGARKYYATIGKTFKELNPRPGITTIDDLLLYAGYPVSGEKVESLDPGILMSPARAASAEGLGLSLEALGGARLRDGDILASRFFAPKIVDVSKDKPIPGWRKLVRFKVRPNADAARAGVQSVIVLFNFVASAEETPFQRRSFNTQVMLLAPALKDRLYWLDFDDKQKLTTALNASFDAALLKSTGNHDYFVPDGCNACHGSPGNFGVPMVNYLDTDHWFDRLDDKFRHLKEAGTPLLFDAQTNDSTQPAFASAFDVIRRFNEEALSQNILVRPKSFETEAARTWLQIHANSNEHFPPVARAFSRDGKPKWEAGEQEGLSRLNRNCFRCHGSVHFSVFERGEVLSRAGNIQQRIRPNKQQLGRTGFKMPPDQDLSAEEIQLIYDFLNFLK